MEQLKWPHLPNVFNCAGDNLHGDDRSDLGVCLCDFNEFDSEWRRSVLKSDCGDESNWAKDQRQREDRFVVGEQRKELAKVALSN